MSRLGLLPEWPGPTPNEAPIQYDLSGSEALRLENEIRVRFGVAEVPPVV